MSSQPETLGSVPRDRAPGTDPGTPATRSHTARRWLGLVPLVALCVVALAASMLVGSRAIPAGDVLHVLLHPDPDDALSQTIWFSRVPRTALIVVAGVALGIAGTLMQAVTRNPMTDPGILGVNAGASLAVVVGLAFFGVGDISQYMWWSFAGAMVTSVLVFVIGNTGSARGNPVRMTLSGVALGAVLSGFSSAVLLTNSHVLEKLRGWSAGTTASQPLDATMAIVPFVVIGVVIAILSSRSTCWRWGRHPRWPWGRTRTGSAPSFSSRSPCSPAGRPPPPAPSVSSGCSPRTSRAWSSAPTRGGSWPTRH
jgi:iron complex transport system permease protein